MRRLAASLCAVMALSAAGCGGDGAAGATTLGPGGCRAPRVLVTTSVLGDVARAVVGDLGTVEVLMPVGADPHSFQASAGQAASLRRADLLLVNGLGLEEGLHDVIEAARGDGVVVVEAASFVAALLLDEGLEADRGEGHGESGLDPHFWLDPVRMAEVAEGLGEALAAADPACAARWRQAAAGEMQSLLDLNGEVAAILEGIPVERRQLVTNHAAFGYFAERYGFDVVGVIVPGGSTLAEPSPADLAALIESLRREGVAVLFTETTQPAGIAEALAAELGGEAAVVALYTGSLGEPGSGADTYAGMLRTDAERIAAALGGPTGE